MKYGWPSRDVAADGLELPGQVDGAHSSFAEDADWHVGSEGIVLCRDRRGRAVTHPHRGRLHERIVEKGAGFRVGS